ncbi:MAG: class I SAM-dependent methyltransferase [Longimicrobiales bacterium]|nr:class I SAM-dependent methyltransferase [Longimicrobiales bacterium]
MSLDYYIGLLEHEDRIEAIRRGIEEAVQDGDRVLDLGTGLGTFSFFAARAGAERVWAVDHHPIIHLARELARANDLDDRIEFVRGRVPDVDLPPDIDVLVFEDFPRRFLDDGVFRMLLTFEETLLARGGRMVPGRARLSIAPADIESARSGATSGPRYGIDWSAARRYWANHPRPSFVPPGSLVGTPVTGPSLPLIPVPRASALRIQGEWGMNVPTRVDALVHWFDLEAAPGMWVTNEPSAAAGPWGQMLLPLDPPLDLNEGEVLEVEARREELSDGAPGWVVWRARVQGTDREVRGHEFAGFPARLDDLYPEATPDRPSGVRRRPDPERPRPDTERR